MDGYGWRQSQRALVELSTVSSLKTWWVFVQYLFVLAISLTSVINDIRGCAKTRLCIMVCNYSICPGDVWLFVSAAAVICYQPGLYSVTLHWGHFWVGPLCLCSLKCTLKTSCQFGNYSQTVSSEKLKLDQRSSSQGVLRFIGPRVRGQHFFMQTPKQLQCVTLCKLSPVVVSACPTWQTCLNSYWCNPFLSFRVWSIDNCPVRIPGYVDELDVLSGGQPRVAALVWSLNNSVHICHFIYLCSSVRYCSWVYTELGKKTWL